MQAFVEKTSPRQREVLGFPPPGHEYWNAETIEAVRLRYPKMDMGPYRANLIPSPPEYRGEGTQKPITSSPYP
jgi:hypothetical protein